MFLVINLLQKALVNILASSCFLPSAHTCVQVHAHTYTHTYTHTHTGG